MSKGFGESISQKKEEPFRKVPRERLDRWLKKALAGSVRHKMKYTNYFRSMWNEGSSLPDSTMIHERDFVPMNCCICGAEMNSIHDTHNPSPIAPHCTAKESLDKGLPHRCCTKCDHSVVIPERVRRIESSGAKGSYQPITDFFNQDFSNPDSYVAKRKLSKEEN